MLVYCLVVTPNWLIDEMLDNKNMNFNGLNCCLFFMMSTCLCVVIVVYRDEAYKVRLMENGFG